MNWHNRFCLVTGGASFIGSHLVEKLLELGACVRVADNLSSGSLNHLQAARNEIEFLEGDLRSLEFADEAVRGCDVVFHLAADHGGRGYIASHPAHCAGNMALDQIVFAAAAKNGVEHLAYASSACVYPIDLQSEKILLQEDMVSFGRRGGAFADEVYGWAKLMGELSLGAYHRQYGMKTGAARLSTVYGPRENESHAVIALIAKVFIHQDPFEIWGDGRQTRGFTHVDDTVRGLILTCENIQDGGAVNIGTSEYIDLNTVAEEIFRIARWRPSQGIRHLLNKPVGVSHRALDISYAKNRIGWCPLVSFADGLYRTVQWYFATHEPEAVSSCLERSLVSR